MTAFLHAQVIGIIKRFNASFLFRKTALNFTKIFFVALQEYIQNYVIFSERAS